MSKENKSVGITPSTEKDLRLQTIERKGVLYKKHCEDILEKVSKMTPEEVIEWLRPAGKVVMKKDSPKKDVEVESRDIAENPSESLLDKSGVFKPVKDNPKIYTNKKCFEFRNFDAEKGVVKSYHATLEDAQEAKNS